MTHHQKDRDEGEFRRWYLRDVCFATLHGARLVCPVGCFDKYVLFNPSRQVCHTEMLKARTEDKLIIKNSWALSNLGAGRYV